jgi:MFS family permease
VVFDCIPRFDAKNASMPHFCDNPNLFHRVDWNDEGSLHNLFEQLDLACSSKAQVGFIGSSLFIGWVLSSLIMPRCADIFGRKPVFCLAIFI